MEPSVYSNDVEAKLAGLGISLPEIASPLALYQPVRRGGYYLYVSGQIAISEGSLVHPGVVGDSVGVDSAIQAARICTINGLAAVKKFIGGLDGIRLMKLSGYVASTPDFHQQPKVIDGASQLLIDVFGPEVGMGARAAIGVSALPLGSSVEVELMFELDPAVYS
jgi:enamine deaminase RidA (YjgF/YER057c/UK114 family)|tara:strand:+ start:2344 stop:2838 length:495 start_codon:yes stop_codon:yes gene_type:complete